MGIYFQHQWLQNYLTQSISSLDSSLLQSLQYCKRVFVKESREHGWSVKTITSKELSSRLTLARVGENTECTPAVRDAAASSSLI